MGKFTLNTEAYDARWWKPELYDQEFARLIIQEVTKVNAKA